MKITFASVVLLFFFSNFGQIEKNDFSLNFDYTFDQTFLFDNKDKGIYLPGNIRDLRRGRLITTLAEEVNQEEYTDIPQFHLASYGALRTELNYLNKYKLTFDFYAEDRSSSQGNLTARKFTFFPNFLLEIKDSVQLFKQTFLIELQAGNLLEFQHNNGLTLYNIDIQGLNAKIKWKELYLNLVQVSDAAFHVPLNIQELISLNLGIEHKKITLSGGIDLLALSQLFLNDSIQQTINVNFRRNGDQNSFYASASLRLNTPNLGLLLGYDFNKEKEKVYAFNLTSKVRYFNSNFHNVFFRSSSDLRFRETGVEIEGNYVGDNIYPLRNQNRSFDRSSIYAEYVTASLFSLASRLKFDRVLYKKLWLLGDLESNFIASADTDNALYFFYKIGTAFKFPLGLELSFYLSNKVYNLDTQYETFYQANVPLFGYSITRDFN